MDRKKRALQQGRRHLYSAHGTKRQYLLSRSRERDVEFPVSLLEHYAEREGGLSSVAAHQFPFCGSELGQSR